MYFPISIRNSYGWVCATIRKCQWVLGQYIEGQELVSVKKKVHQDINVITSLLILTVKFLAPFLWVQKLDGISKIDYKALLAILLQKSARERKLFRLSAFQQVNKDNALGKMGLLRFRRKYLSKCQPKEKSTMLLHLGDIQKLCTLTKGGIQVGTSANVNHTN